MDVEKLSGVEKVLDAEVQLLGSETWLRTLLSSILPGDAWDAAAGAAVYHAVGDVGVQLVSETELRMLFCTMVFWDVWVSSWAGQTVLRRLSSTMVSVMALLLSKFRAHGIEEVFHDSVCGGFPNH